MKKLIIIVVITAVSSLYFIIDAERHLTFQAGGKPEEAALQENSEVTPLGTDLVKIISENVSGSIKKTTENSKEFLKDSEKGLTPDTTVSSVIAGIKEEVQPEVGTAVEDKKKEGYF